MKFIKGLLNALWLTSLVFVIVGVIGVVGFGYGIKAATSEGGIVDYCKEQYKLFGACCVDIEGVEKVVVPDGEGLRDLGWDDEVVRKICKQFSEIVLT